MYPCNSSDNQFLKTIHATNLLLKYEKLILFFVLDGFGLLGGQNKKFEEVTLGTSGGHFSIFLLTLYIQENY